MTTVTVVEDQIRVATVGTQGPPGPAPWFVATDYGGTWDGVSDDSTALQAALDANAAAGGGGQVWLPLGGLARINTIVTIDAPVTIVGNQTVITIAADAAFRTGSSDVTLIGARFQSADATSRDLLERWEGAGDYSGWNIRDCVLDNVALRFERFGRMGADGIAKTMGTGIATHSRIERCELHSLAANYTLALGGVTDVTIDGCYIHDCGVDVSSGDGIKVLDSSRDIRILNTTIEDVTRDCIDVYDGNRITVSGCHLNRAGALAIDAKFSTTDSNDTDLNIISNNRSDGCAAGFNIAVSRALVAGNICENSGGYGFRVSHSNDNPAVYAAFVSLIGNLAYNCVGDGITLTAGDGLLVEGNQAHNNGGYGIAVSATLVTNSRFMNNGTYGNTTGGILIGGASNQYFGNAGPGTTDNEIRIPNNTRMRLLQADGTPRDVMYMSTSNVFSLGNSNNSMNLLAGTVFGFGTMDLQGQLRHRGSTLGFYNTVPTTKQTVTGSRTDGTALASLLTALAAIGLITDSSTA